MLCIDSPQDLTKRLRGRFHHSQIVRDAVDGLVHRAHGPASEGGRLTSLPAKRLTFFLLMLDTRCPLKKKECHRIKWSS